MVLCLAEDWGMSRPNWLVCYLCDPTRLSTQPFVDVCGRSLAFVSHTCTITWCLGEIDREQMGSISPERGLPRPRGLPRQTGRHSALPLSAAGARQNPTLWQHGNINAWNTESESALT